MTPDQHAANLIADFPAAENLSGLGRATSRVIKAAIQTEREACAGVAQQPRQRGASEGSHSDPNRLTGPKRIQQTKSPGASANGLERRKRWLEPPLQNDRPGSSNNEPACKWKKTAFAKPNARPAPGA